MKQFSISSPIDKLQPYVTNNQGLWNLLMNKNTGERFYDNLCFFRCLALQRGASPRFTENSTRHYAETYRQHTGKKQIDEITLDELSIVEELFQVNVQVYMLLPTDDSDENEMTNSMEADSERDVNVKHRFSGGTYQLPLTVFDKLSELGVVVEDEMKYFA